PAPLSASRGRLAQPAPVRRAPLCRRARRRGVQDRRRQPAGVLRPGRHTDGASGARGAVAAARAVMLSREDNELLCRVGPGTPMGNLMRQYWIPAALPSELPEPDGAPLRVRLLGESLIAFRVSSGAVGLIQNSCPHRGASLFYGRNEAEGLRCVYHGWKFDVRGRCLDMPIEPAGSTFKDKVRARAYPCIERGGLVWAYLG